MRLKLQSAMEYLMTYGWAILVISIVLAAMFQLGLFNPNTYTNTAPPGACSISRPQGPGTNLLVSLVGVCNNLPPKYVARLVGVWHTNAATNGIRYTATSQNTLVNNIAKQISVSVWANLATISSPYAYLVSNNRDCCAPEAGWGVRVYNGYPQVQMWDTANVLHTTGSGSAMNTNQWYSIIATYDGSYLKLYVNGTLKANAAVTGDIGTPASWAFNIGSMGYANNNYYGTNGSVSNVQVYNVSLTADGVSALYKKGIGGAPIDLKYLVGWWPLNGNANDYSGNGNSNAILNSVIFSSNWQGGYVAP